MGRERGLRQVVDVLGGKKSFAASCIIVFVNSSIQCRVILWFSSPCFLVNYYKLGAFNVAAALYLLYLMKIQK